MYSLNSRLNMTGLRVNPTGRVNPLTLSAGLYEEYPAVRVNPIPRTGLRSDKFLNVKKITT